MRTVALNKFLAKVASGVAKPDGLLVVPPHDELGFLHPLPVELLWGVGRVTASKLRGRGITTVGQVARFDQSALVWMLGRAGGRQLHALAHNRDPRPVRVGRRRGSIGAQRALGARPRSRDEVDATLVALVDRVSSRLRAGRRVCRTVVLRMRFGDFSRATRSHTMPRATSGTRVILAAARELLSAAQPLVAARGLTLVGIGLHGLEHAYPIQLALPLDRENDDALDAALDLIRTGSARRRSRARCSSAERLASRCRCSRTEVAHPVAVPHACTREPGFRHLVPGYAGSQESSTT